MEASGASHTPAVDSAQAPGDPAVESAAEARKADGGWPAAVAPVVCLVVLLALLAWGQGSQLGKVVYSTNDRGRDLHCALLVSEGKLPYRDFDWPYGPLMPRYYGLWFRVIGPSIGVFDTAEIALRLACSLAVFWMALGCMKTIRAGAAARAVGALAVGLAWSIFGPLNGHFHTGNHVGGTLLLSLMLGWTFRMLSPGKEGGAAPAASPWPLAVFAFLLALVKLNVAVVFIIVCFGALAWRFRDRRSLRLLGVAGGACVAAAIAVYLPLVLATPAESIPRCFPFLGSYRQDYGSVWTRMAVELRARPQGWRLVGPLSRAAFLFIGARAAMFAVFALLGLVSVLLARVWTKKNDALRAAAVVVMLSLVAGGHELFLAGAYYSVPFWASPAMALVPVLLCVLILRRFGDAVALRRLTPAIILLLLAVGAAIFLVQGRLYLRGQGGWEPVRLVRAGVMALHSPKDASSWAGTVEGTVRFIQENTEAGEAVLVVPMDAIYLFLSGRPHACRTTDFSAIQRIGPDEQKRIMGEMEAGGVRLVVWTNTTISTPTAHEVFGKTHCRLLASYITENFRPAAGFGAADRPGHGFRNHGTTVWLRRSGP